MEELTEIRVADVENTALTTYTDPPKTYNTPWNTLQKMDSFHIWISLSTLKNPLLFTKKPDSHRPLCLLQFLCPFIFQKRYHQITYKTSSHPMLPQHLQTELDTVYKVQHIKDSVKKLENPNKLTLNIQRKSTTPSLTTSFPFHPTITKQIKISRILQHQSHKLFRNYLTDHTLLSSSLPI